MVVVGRESVRSRGGYAMALPGQQQHNTCMVALFAQEVGDEHAAMFRGSGGASVAGRDDGGCGCDMLC